MSIMGLSGFRCRQHDDDRLATNRRTRAARRVHPILPMALVVLAALPIRASAQSELHMPDGQLFTRQVKIYTNAPDLDAKVRVKLVGREPISLDYSEWPGKITAITESQTFTVSESTKTGTLLLCSFSASNVPWYQPVARVTPILEWESAGIAKTLAGTDEVHIGNPRAAVFWTGLLLVFFLLSLHWLSKRSRTSSSNWPAISGFVCDHNRLSLARTQVALFTLAIGATVLGYGMLMPEVPKIPGTLLALMGLSLVTGGISHVTSPAATKRDSDPKWWHLVSVEEAGVEVLSIARAQMLLWTLVTLVLFFSRTLADGALWPVPVEMVGLMGLSQAGYLSTKVNKPTSLLYRDVKARYAVGEIVELKPTSTGGPILTYSADALPPDLVLDPASGVISGQLSAPCEGKYKITGVNKDTAVAASVDIRVG